MNITELIQLSETRIAYLSMLLNDAAKLGDTTAMIDYQNKINDAQQTLIKLKTLL